MTLKEFTQCLHRHIGYTFYPMSQNEYSIYGFVASFKGYIKEEKGKFYMQISSPIGNAILSQLDVSYQRVLCYKPIGDKVYAIYEISIRQDKATYS